MELFHDLPTPLQVARARLASHPRVAGALLIGSLPAGALSPTSDYDLVVIIDDLEPLWYVGVTTRDRPHGESPALPRSGRAGGGAAWRSLAARLVRREP
jgi:hypothetical protein